MSRHHTLSEILGQPQTWKAVLRDVPQQAEAIAPRWPAAQRDEAYFTGCGSPFFLARTAASLFQAQCAVPSRAEPASDWLFFPEVMVGRSTSPLFVVFSRSGETTELLSGVERFRDLYPGAVSVGIICRPGTSLEARVDHAVIVPEAEEVGLAQTRSFTGMMAAAQCLTAAMAGRALSSAFLDLPAHCEAVLAQAQPVAGALAEDPGLEQFFFLGSGPLYGLACESMLKMKEVSLSHSEAYHFLEFRHGPMTLVDSKTLVVGLVSEAALEHEVAVLAQMRAMGARVLAITPAALSSGWVDHQVVLPGGLTDWERGPLYLPAVQLLAYGRAVAKGLQPDELKNLSAYVSLDMTEIESRAVRGPAV